ncbi:aspartic proteinase [Colletotrichum truncatum]|uniref:Aspartic proteinase n=1 Tax=Colletotrichum truncatum TaxID=5467 RepID=A0ACC3Z8S9_COLTU|nr:aspartic proteinase [Colletotrichum truncatum]KAF6789316.1 aspartic proteinase [Colletotrichum truncatum]
MPSAIDRSKFQESLIRFPVDTSLTTLKLFGTKIHSVNGSRNSANPFQPLGGLDTLSLYKPVVRIAPHNTISWLPYYLARHIYELAGAVWDDQLQARAVNCNSKASTAQLAVQLHGADGPILNVPVSDLVGPGVPGRTMRSAGTNWCLFGVQSYNTSDPYRYTLGGTMLKRAYMVFDLANGEIAIGKTKFDSATREDVVYFPSYGAKVPESSAVSPSPGWCYEHSSSEYCSSDRTRPIYGDDEESKSRFRGGITKGGWIAIAVCMSVVVVIIVVLSIRAFRKWRRIKREEKELAGEHQNAMCAAYGVSGKQTGLTSQRKVDIIHHANMCTMSRESDENTITSGRRQ